jgi:hypothetical protein
VTSTARRSREWRQWRRRPGEEFSSHLETQIACGLAEPRPVEERTGERMREESKRTSEAPSALAEEGNGIG